MQTSFTAHPCLVKQRTGAKIFIKICFGIWYLFFYPLVFLTYCRSRITRTMSPHPLTRQPRITQEEILIVKL